MKSACRSALVALGVLLIHVAAADAVELLFDFEGDSGTSVTDKLTDDGSQNGVTFQNVDPADTAADMFGTQSAFFDLPVALPALSVVKVPDTVFPSDFSMTLAAFVKHDPTINRLTRVFSTFSGAGATTDQIILDYDPPVGDTYVRAIIDGNVYRTPLASPPAGLGTPGYHHYAVTVNAGEVKVYFDGVNYATENTALLPTGYNFLHNIQIGEDRGGAANEQLVGNVDEVLVLQRALSATDIGLLASGIPVSTVVTPVAEERSVYYNLEGDSGTMFTDTFALDGGQNGEAQGDTTVDTNPLNARLGDNSLHIGQLPPPVQHSVIRAGAPGVLGPQFTLSATVNAPIGGQPSGTVARILSTFAGTGGTAGRLIFDFNPSGAAGSFGVRLILPDGTTTSSLGIDIDKRPALNVNQTITATYDLGVVKLYLNGVEIASNTIVPRIINLGSFDLSIGEDLGGAVNEQFVGNMDDVLVISQVLAPEQIANLHTMGASAVVASLPDPVISGDYNDNGEVDAADYVVWRKTLSMTGPGLAADGNGDEIIDTKDYVLWRYNFGKTVPLASGADLAAVPEPSTMVFLSIFTATAAFARAKRRSLRVTAVN